MIALFFLPASEGRGQKSFAAAAVFCCLGMSSALPRLSLLLRSGGTEQKRLPFLLQTAEISASEVFKSNKKDQFCAGFIVEVERGQEYPQHDLPWKISLSAAVRKQASNSPATGCGGLFSA